MQQGRTYNVIRNISSGLIYKLISIFLPFILRTVMIHYMGIQYAGLNTLFTISFLWLAFSNDCLYANKK